MIRIASPGDAKGMLDIYAPYIENTSFTFETETPSIEAFGDRIDSYLVTYPWLVCELDGRVAGYAYASKHRERTAYQWSVESSVYIHNDYLRCGVGRALYIALIEILKLQQFRNVYAVINLPNERSVVFHESMGFEYFAVYRNVGYKLGKWKNVGWWQLQLNEYISEPPAPIKFSGMDGSVVSDILRKASFLIRNNK
jgi:L-amino acid N-acyltransferase YncA